MQINCIAKPVVTFVNHSIHDIAPAPVDYEHDGSNSIDCGKDQSGEDGRMVFTESGQNFRKSPGRVGPSAAATSAPPLDPDIQLQEILLGDGRLGDDLGSGVPANDETFLQVSSYTRTQQDRRRLPDCVATSVGDDWKKASSNRQVPGHCNVTSGVTRVREEGAHRYFRVNKVHALKKGHRQRGS